MATGLLRIALFSILPAIAAGLAYAQAKPGGCAVKAVLNPPRTVLSCPNGVGIIAEEGTEFTLQDRSAAAGPEAARLDGKALLLDVPAGGADGGFEVITPQAIAAVRGTRWAVDVGADRTSVFVVEGRVSVSRQAGAPAVSLGAGEGVDVGPGAEPLTVKRWGAARAAALMARFGE